MVNSETFPAEWLNENIAEIGATLPNYMKKVFDDLLGWPDLRYVLAVGDGGGEITHAVTPGGKVLSKPSIDTRVFFNFSSIVEDYLTRVKQPSSANITIELEDEMLLIAQFGSVQIVALFACSSEQGLMSELIYQRVTALQKQFV